MTRNDVGRAVAIAKTSDDLSDHDILVFNGFGLANFAPVYVTLSQVARLIRWQCCGIFGGFDSQALQEIAAAGRRRFLIVG